MHLTVRTCAVSCGFWGADRRSSPRHRVRRAPDEGWPPQYSSHLQRDHSRCVGHVALYPGSPSEVSQRAHRAHSCCSCGHTRASADRPLDVGIPSGVHSAHDNVHHAHSHFVRPGWRRTECDRGRALQWRVGVAVRVSVASTTGVRG
jgi:hypothetical protein